MELPNLDAVRREAAGFARDMMRLRRDRTDWSDWEVRVTDETGVMVYELPFVDVSD